MTIDTPQTQQQITYPYLPLAVYREIAAHLQQIEGVMVELLPQDAPSFDYAQSQIKALILTTSKPLTETQQDQIQSILDYYSKIHGQCSVHPILDTKSD
ncbi:MAG: hypothetical protein AB4041_01105 [Microcystaceae cyanobacterium]